MRVASVTIPDSKRMDIALTYIYGIGRSNVLPILESSKIDGAKKAKDLTEEEIKRITKVLETYKIEGDLKADIASDIRRLKESGSYRGIRHSRGLPSRGQRTRSNARTKRGKRLTIGAIKKEVAAKMEAAAKSKGK
jgi:small subunit ribosomal protein S13